MYDYRRMSPAERWRIVQWRRSRGYPDHRPPHLAFGPGWYFATAATYEHRMLFEAPGELAALTNRLLESYAASNLPVAGWVVIPNHHHELVHSARTQLVGRALRPVHARAARYANLRDDAEGRQVWYRYTDRFVRSERHFWTCLHYIIMNPVKHGFVSRPEDWPWSCVHELISRFGREWIADLQREYPLHDFGRGWDDWVVG